MNSNESLALFTDTHNLLAYSEARLDPHGSNFPDVVDALQHLALLDRGIDTVIDGGEVFLCAYTHMFLGDMPQQQQNSGMKSQNAEVGCRFYYIPSSQRNNLDYDITENGRFHHQVMNMRREMNALPTKKAKLRAKNLGAKLGRKSSLPHKLYLHNREQFYAHHMPERIERFEKTLKK